MLIYLLVFGTLYGFMSSIYISYCTFNLTIVFNMVFAASFYGSACLYVSVSIVVNTCLQMWSLTLATINRLFLHIRWRLFIHHHQKSVDFFLNQKKLQLRDVKVTPSDSDLSPTKHLIDSTSNTNPTSSSSHQHCIIS